MDNKDQRNASVPLGTFNEENAADSNENTGDDLFIELSEQDSDNTSSAEFARTRPGRKRVRTLLGVPLAEVKEPAATAGLRSESISEAIQHMLDEQHAIAIQVDESEADEYVAVLGENDLAELGDSGPSGVLSVKPDADDSVSDDAPTQTRIPLLVPSQYMEAQARDLAQDGPAAELPAFRDDAPTTPRLEAVSASEASRTASATAAAVVAAATGGAAMAATAPAKAASPAPQTSTASSSRSKTGASGRAAIRTATAASMPPGQPNISSLAPREVARQPATKDAGPGVGLLMVAAMALIAAGGWWITAGSFSRSKDQGASGPQAASQPLAAPNEAPMARATEPSMQAEPPPQTAEVTPSMTPQRTESADTDQNSAAPSPVKSRSLTATSRALRTRAPAAPKLVPTKDPAGLPEAPSRTLVIERMESVRSLVHACAAGLSGIADLDVTIAHSGVVTHVLVGGDFAGTTQGSCIARAVREARFPSFKQERFRLLFPYAI